MVVIVDPDGVVRYVNPPVTELFDRPCDELLGSNIVDLVHPDDRTTALEALDATVELGPGGRGLATLRVLPADGSARIVELVGNNLMKDPVVGGILVSARDVTDLVRARKQLEHQATHDALTKLPNRLLFEELGEQALARAARHGQDVAVLFVDLDHFKRVNDTYGHPVGDQLLEQVAKRLRKSLRLGDVVARFGGDEFVVLCERSGQGDEVNDLAGRVIEAVSKPTPLGALVAQVGASVGIAVGSGDGVTIHTLLRDADAALYQAKDQGRGRAVRFSERRGARVAATGALAQPALGFGEQVAADREAAVEQLARDGVTVTDPQQ
jgi:diguanylate cyclase (GGDEF)-like protein/PAS domain S-box-containing protein